MTPTDPAKLRRALAAELEGAGVLRTPAWRKAVEDVPRENFLPWFFRDETDARGRSSYLPVGPSTDPEQRLALVYRDETWVTQLDGHLTAETATGPVTGFPTSSSTRPSTVLAMNEAAEVEDGMTVQEIGTGTGYSTALWCHRLGEEHVTTIEVDADVTQRADDALELVGYSTWTRTGDGLLGNPWRAPYDRTVATCAVRRIPLAWVRQTRPGGVILATLGPGAWSYGTGLAKLVVEEDGVAEGRLIDHTSFMPARAEAPLPLSGDLAARAAYAETRRAAAVTPDELTAWMPALLAQLAAPGAQLVRALSNDGETVYLFDTARESFASLARDGTAWQVRQGGPFALWDAVETAVTTWREVGEPGITSVCVRVTPAAHTYWIDSTHHGASPHPALSWTHPHPPLPT